TPQILQGFQEFVAISCNYIYSSQNATLIIEKSYLLFQERLIIFVLELCVHWGKKEFARGNKSRGFGIFLSV
ncbi:MAG: hypothetical protein ABIH42_05840, partial [Planctomycetota bacterium]